MNAVKKRGGEAIGLTLSSGQVKYCQSKGLDIRLLDYKKINILELGKFDAIISIGAFEHFCSVSECIEGKQEEVYRQFFEICSKLLNPGGGLYLQTMTWGKKDPDPKYIIDNWEKAETNSDEAIIGRLLKFYPGSWLPSGLEQIKKCAGEYFNFEKTNNGRLDYIETLKRWSASSKNLLNPSIIFSTIKASVPLIFRAMKDPDARTQLKALFYGDQSTCFKQEIMSHERMFYFKK